MMTKILILGGGFGGIRVALDLEKKLGSGGGVEITLVDKNDSQTFQPALYEVASIYGIDHEHPYHTKLRGTICIPYGEIFKNKKVNLVQAEVNHIDIQNKHVVTGNGTALNFDFLIVALGSVYSTFGVVGADDYAFKFKTIEDGLMLNDKIEELYTEASKSNRPLPIRIILCGAGFNGIELAAELSNCTVHTAHKHKITVQNCTVITLIEAGPTILPMISDGGRNLILKRLKKLGINFMVNSTIQEIGPGSIKFKDGAMLEGDLIIWTGGVKALDIFKTAGGLESDDRGRILVNDYLQIQNYPNVFAVGDNLVFKDPKTQKPIPQLAYLAIEQGRVVAKNIIRMIGNDEKPILEFYKPDYKFWIAPVGGKYAVASLGPWIFSGFLGYIVREVVDLRYFLLVLPFLKAVEIFFKGIKVFSKND